MRRYDLDQRAADDIIDLVEYVQDYSDRARDRFTDALVDAFEHLAEYSHSGRARPELAPGLRSLPVNRLAVTIYYVVLAGEGDRVLVARILQPRRDVSEADFE